MRHQCTLGLEKAGWGALLFYCVATCCSTVLQHSVLLRCTVTTLYGPPEVQLPAQALLAQDPDVAAGMHA